MIFQQILEWVLKLNKAKVKKQKKINLNNIDIKEPEEQKEICLTLREYTENEIKRRNRYFERLTLPILIDPSKIQHSIHSVDRDKEPNINKGESHKPLQIVSPDYFYKK